jgi:hypothetical protein
MRPLKESFRHIVTVVPRHPGIREVVPKRCVYEHWKVYRVVTQLVPLREDHGKGDVVALVTKDVTVAFFYLGTTEANIHMISLTDEVSYKW